MPFAAHVTTISHVTCAETPVCGAENGLKSALFRPFTALGSEMSRLYKRLPNTLVQSNPSIPPILGLAKKRRYSKNGGIYWESYITYRTLIWDLERGGGIGRGGIEGTTVAELAK